MKKKLPLFQTIPPFDKLQEPDEDINIELVGCKFWKKTQEEAKRFYLLYSHRVFPFETIVALCAGDFDKRKNIEKVLTEIKKAISDIYPTGYCKEYTIVSRYHDIIERIALKCNPHLECLKHKSKHTRLLYHLPLVGEVVFEMLSENIKDGYLSKDDLPRLNQKIENLATTPQMFTFADKTMDDILQWLDRHQIINKASLAKAERQIRNVRGPVFTGTSAPTIKHRVQLIKFLMNNSMYLSYDEAKEILFPKTDLREKLETSCQNNSILYFIQSSDKKQYLFEIESLMKWLVIEKDLDPELRNHFSRLVEEATKQAVFDCPELLTLEQLKEYLKYHSPESQDVEWHVGNRIYPAYIKLPHGNKHHYIKRLPTKSVSKPTYEKRFRGIERLRHPSNDSHMLFSMLYSEQPIKPDQFLAYIEVESTDDEAALGQFRYINLTCGLTQKNLVFIKNEVKAGLMKLQKEDSGAENHNAMNASVNDINDHINKIFDKNISTAFENTPPKGKPGFNFAGAERPQNELKTIRSKQTRAHALNELIAKLYSNATDKSPQAIWKELQKLASEEHSTISKVDAWTYEHAKIHWVSHRGVPRSIARHSFETKISALNSKYFPS